MSEIKKVVTVPETPQDSSVDTFISKAIEANMSVETMEKFFVLRDKARAEFAKSAFVRAMSLFQGKCPIIKKTKRVLNKDGQTVRYTYAPIDSIVEQIKESLAESGLSYTWTVKNDDKFIAAIATVTHLNGHSESSEFKVPIDTEGFMTAPQKYASALTFAKRYSLCNALGISTGDEDTDATDVGKEGNAKSDKSKIIFLLRTLKYSTKTKEEIARTVKEITSLELDSKNYGEIVGRLEILVSEAKENEGPTIR